MQNYSASELMVLTWECFSAGAIGRILPLRVLETNDACDTVLGFECFDHEPPLHHEGRAFRRLVIEFAKSDRYEIRWS